jgi:hypothetical protein
MAIEVTFVQIEVGLAAYTIYIKQLDIINLAW